MESKGPKELTPEQIRQELQRVRSSEFDQRIIQQRLELLIEQNGNKVFDIGEDLLEGGDHQLPFEKVLRRMHAARGLSH